MNKLIRWLKAVNQNAKTRGELILAARERLACMETHWQEANKSNDEVAVMLMSIGLAHIETLYQVQLLAQNIIRSRQAPLN